MPTARANGIEIVYEVVGDSQAPLLLLIMGYSVQLIAWPDGLFRMLAERGFRVVRFDNRDVGLSSKVQGSYTLEDMAADTAGLLDTLGVEQAHVVGASMGGFIAQLLAIHHPTRVRSLCSIMSTTGASGVGGPRPEILRAVLRALPGDRTGYIESRLAVVRAIASPGFPFEEAGIRAYLGRAWDRGFHPEGAARQLAAVMAAHDRTSRLGLLRVPTVVIHGADDPMVDVSGGEATARAIPGARLVVIPGMGHDLPRGAWPQIVDAIVENAQRAP